jgi:hypothetical protein
MARNQVQFQKGISLPDFIHQFGTISAINVIGKPP